MSKRDSIVEREKRERERKKEVKVNFYSLISLSLRVIFASIPFFRTFHCIRRFNHFLTQRVCNLCIEKMYYECTYESKGRIKGLTTIKA